MPGRKPGGHNQKPAKSLLAQAEFAELVLPHLKEYFDRLHGIALNSTSEKNSLGAIKELLDRALGKPRETIEFDVPGAEDADMGELLALWRAVKK